jgi:hypothetical protein
MDMSLERSDSWPWTWRVAAGKWPWTLTTKKNSILHWSRAVAFRHCGLWPLQCSSNVWVGDRVCPAGPYLWSLPGVPA